MSFPVLHSYPSSIREALYSLSRSVLFVFGLLLLSVSLGCHKKVAAPNSTPTQSTKKLPTESAPPAITPSEIPSTKPAPPPLPPAPKVVEVPSSLDLGMTSFKEGNYGKAAQLFEDYLKKGSNFENRDTALFHLFLSRALPANSGRNLRRAEDDLKRLIKEYPNSSYRKSAELIVGLQTQIENLKSDIKEKETKIKQLSEELQKLKDIDMQRRPSRPLY
jgi:hypothetical protein